MFELANQRVEYSTKRLDYTHNLKEDVSIEKNFSPGYYYLVDLYKDGKYHMTYRVRLSDKDEGARRKVEKRNALSHLSEKWNLIADLIEEQTGVKSSEGNYVFDEASIC